MPPSTNVSAKGKKTKKNPKPTASPDAVGSSVSAPPEQMAASLPPPNADNVWMNSSSMMPLTQLDSLFGHLSCSSGLFSKETFLSLFSCITKMLRDHHQQMEGFVMARTLEDSAFDSMAHALSYLPNIPYYTISSAPAEINPKMGFLLVLTNRLCATLYWSNETHDSFQMYEGGWTFHPADSRTLANYVIERLSPADNLTPVLKQHLDSTQVDRRYDDKLNLLVTALVNGLENRNRQLTVALSQVKNLNHQVVQSERLAAIGQLSSVIAHEIRNPLGLIDLYAKLVETQLGQLELPQNDTTEKIIKNLGQIRQATSGLETILSELTSYARPLTLNCEPVDLVQLVHDICEFYHPSYQDKKVTLSFPNLEEFKDAKLILSLDRDRVRQALINLLKNALEASKPETEVIVSVVSRRGGHELIYVKVSDQGCGIKPESAKKLFTPYFSTKQAGTGLGLAHSRKILQAHGGDVELISSYPDKGSTFAIILPKPEIPVSLDD